ncbi:hypothetical protein EVB27_060 [Rhizobium phage RHph_TM16]|nr:hypothetical protein EVB27_060 [Rhizobium phage RHph_TM16]
MIIREREISKGVTERKYEMSPMTKGGRTAFKVAMWCVMGWIPLGALASDMTLAAIILFFVCAFLINALAGPKPVEEKIKPANDK